MATNSNEDYMPKQQSWAEPVKDGNVGTSGISSPRTNNSTSIDYASASTKDTAIQTKAPDNDGIFDDEVRDGKRTVVPKNGAEAIEEHFYNKNGKGEKSEFGNMQDVIDYLYKAREAIHIPTKEDLEKERRRKRTEGIIAAMADGASAVSNLIHTTQYAPDMYRHENSMSEEVKQRFDRIKKQHDDDADRYLNYSLMIGKLKDAQEVKEYQRGRDALADTLAQLKAAHNARLSDIKYRRISQQIDDAQEAAENREADRELDRKIKEARVDEIKSRTSKNNRWQPSSGRGGGGGKGRHPWRDVKGVFGKPGAIVYESSAEGAREMAAMHGGHYLTTETVRTTDTTDAYGDSKRTVSTTNKSTKGANTRKLGL